MSASTLQVDLLTAMVTLLQEKVALLEEMLKTASEAQSKALEMAYTCLATLDKQRQNDTPEECMYGIYVGSRFRPGDNVFGVTTNKEVAFDAVKGTRGQVRRMPMSLFSQRWWDDFSFANHSERVTW